MKSWMDTRVYNRAFNQLPKRNMCALLNARAVVWDTGTLVSRHFEEDSVLLHWIKRVGGKVVPVLVICAYLCIIREESIFYPCARCHDMYIVVILCRWSVTFTCRDSDMLPPRWQLQHQREFN